MLKFYVIELHCVGHEVNDDYLSGLLAAVSYWQTESNLLIEFYTKKRLFDYEQAEKRIANIRLIIKRETPVI